MQVQLPRAANDPSFTIAELRLEHAATFATTDKLPSAVTVLKHDFEELRGLQPLVGPIKLFEAASNPSRAISVKLGQSKQLHIFSVEYKDTTLEALAPSFSKFLGDWTETLAKAVRDWRDSDRVSIKKPAVETIQSSLEFLDELLKKLSTYLPARVASHSQTIAIVLKVGEKTCLAYLAAEDTNLPKPIH